MLELEAPDYNPEVSFYEDEAVEDLTGKPNRDFTAPALGFLREEHNSRLLRTERLARHVSSSMRAGGS